MNSQSLASFLRTDDVVFVGHLRPDDVSLYERYKTIAKQYRDQFSFGVSGPEQRRSVIRCYNNVDDEQHEVTEFDDAEVLQSFIKQCSTPLVPEITRKNEAEYTQVTFPSNHVPSTVQRRTGSPVLSERKKPDALLCHDRQ